MPDYLFLMHNDASLPEEESASDLWSAYLDRLGKSGNLRGGSAIGSGICLRKSGEAPDVSGHLSGFIRVSADDLDHARRLVDGNPVFDAGGTVEIRELPRTD